MVPYIKDQNLFIVKRHYNVKVSCSDRLVYITDNIARLLKFLEEIL